MKNVLIIAFDFAPYNTTGAFRTIRFVKHLHHYSVKPFILTASYKDANINEQLCKEVPNGTHVYRVYSRFKYGSDYKTDWVYTKKYSDKMFTKILRIIKDFILSPDIQLYWCIKTLPKALAIIRKEKIETVYCSGSPFSLFVLGLWLKKLAKVRLVIDYRDPWSSNPSQVIQSVIRQKRNLILESKVLNVADMVIVTSHKMVKELKEIKENLNYTIIPNGFDVDEFKNINYNLPINKEIFTFGYCGKFDILDNTYNPEIIINILNKFDEKYPKLAKKIRFMIIGKINSATNEFINKTGYDKFIFKGYMKKQDTINELSKCDAFIHFYYPNELNDVMSLKLFEYTQLKKPILSISTVESLIGEFLDKSSTGFIVNNNDIEEAVNMLHKILHTNLTEFREGVDEDYLHNYDITKLTKKLAEVLSFEASSKIL